MSLKRVREHLKKWNRDQDIMEFETLIATVEQAAATIGVEPARIAKTLSFKDKNDQGFLIVTAGDAKISNKKFKETFGFKARMLKPDEVEKQTGHVIGGVCPFSLINDLDIFLDTSLQRFQTVFPSCGSVNSAIEVSIDELEKYTGAKTWINVCKAWQEAETV